ncbi:MAG TPA: hypothetical protein VIF15_10900 [Polyangiaceae bacterium]|jgi:hypothetical protein
MSTNRLPALALAALATLLASACNDERKQECALFLPAMKPLDEGIPGADTVDRVNAAVGAMSFKDQPLGVYAANYRKTLTVLSATLKLKASSAAPDGTDDVVKQNLKEARTDRDDIQRYCSQ